MASSGSEATANVAVLFARRDSIYKELGCDVWDIDRDARKWPGGVPCVAHPPCRAWGNFAWNSHHTPEEKALGPWAVEQVRKWGGVLEHPRGSKLWKAASLPRPENGEDQFGGYTIVANQFLWGHKALKPTWLYICGTRDLPPIPQRGIGSAPTHYVSDGGKGGGKHLKFLSKKSREKTPVSMAHWLVEVARRCRTK